MDEKKKTKLIAAITPTQSELDKPGLLGKGLKNLSQTHISSCHLDIVLTHEIRLCTKHGGEKLMQ